MIIHTLRFGEIEVDNSKKLVFQDGLPGFEELHTFAVLVLEETQPIYWLQSLEEPGVTLPVLDPFEIMGKQYVLEINDHEVEALKLEEEEDLLVLVVTVIPEDLTLMTANMAAPILINVRRGIGKQVFIDNRTSPVRFPIYMHLMAHMKEMMELEKAAGSQTGDTAKGESDHAGTDQKG